MTFGRRDRRRNCRFIARLLLIIFISATACKSLHHHDVSETKSFVCLSCQHHVHHAGHLTVPVTSFCNCTLCQSLSQPYLTPDAITLPPVQEFVLQKGEVLTAMPVHASHNSQTPRAPPFILL